MKKAINRPLFNMWKKIIIILASFLVSVLLIVVFYYLMSIRDSRAVIYFENKSGFTIDKLYWTCGGKNLGKPIINLINDSKITKSIQGGCDSRYIRYSIKGKEYSSFIFYRNFNPKIYFIILQKNLKIKKNEKHWITYF